VSFVVQTLFVVNSYPLNLLLTFPLQAQTSLNMQYFLRSLFAFALALHASSTTAQCPPGQDEVRLEIDTDGFFSEIRWVLSNVDSTAVYGTGTVPDASIHNFYYCVPAGECVKFTIVDSNGDGLFPDGYYRIYVNGVLAFASQVGSFFKIQRTVFNCPPGTSCASPILLDYGNWTTPDGTETWFRFTPVENGTYVLSSCDAGCPTKIWMYDRCAGIFIAEDNLGTISYTTDGCPNGNASALVNLEAGETYFFRLRYADPDCSMEPVPYSFEYLGPVVGCMDSLACNFEPLATSSSGVCIYPGDPACPVAPDLEMNEERLLNSLLFEDMENPDPCTVEDGCTRGLGTRYIIRFATEIRNVGDADYYIGKRPTDPNQSSPYFVYDPCHGHWHYLGYAEYLLYNSVGARLPIGTKAGFCVLDGLCFGTEKKYNCNNMGISANCGDVYGRDTPCQWIDITGLPADDYTMVVRVNWDQKPDLLGRVEKRYDNNWAQACFNLSYDGATPEVLFSSDSCAQFSDCAGEVFGNALPDCNGVCNGPALQGDWNQDTLRNADDVTGYLNAALNSDGVATNCSDLFEDALINVYDAALLQECNLHTDDPQYWIQRFPCQFPTGFLNTLDLVNLRLGAIDTVAKTLDIQIVNPFNGIMAYDFSVSGLNIASVENLVPEHQATPLFNPSTGKIVALATDESSIPKNAVPANFLRLHYTGFTAAEVCIAEISAVVNHKYQGSNAIIANPDCIPVNTVGVTETHGKAAFPVYVLPNPMAESSTVFFENKNAEPMRFVLTDLTGRTLRLLEGIRGESVLVERAGLPSGTYIFQLSGSRGSVGGKILMR